MDFELRLRLADQGSSSGSFIRAHNPSLNRNWGDTVQPSTRSRPWDKGGGGDADLPTKFFRSFGPQFGPKIRGRLPPLDPPLQPSSKLYQTDQVTDHKLWYVQSTVNKAQSYGAKCSEFFSLSNKYLQCFKFKLPWVGKKVASGPKKLDSSFFLQL